MAGCRVNCTFDKVTKVRPAAEQSVSRTATLLPLDVTECDVAGNVVENNRVLQQQQKCSQPSAVDVKCGNVSRLIDKKQVIWRRAQGARSIQLL
jgi:hypothetical protein